MSERLNEVITAALLNAGWLRDLCPIVCTYARRTNLDTLWLLLHGRKSRRPSFYIDACVKITWRHHGGALRYTVFHYGHASDEVELTDLVPRERIPEWCKRFGGRTFTEDDCEGWYHGYKAQLHALMAVLDV